MTRATAARQVHVPASTASHILTTGTEVSHCPRLRLTSCWDWSPRPLRWFYVSRAACVFNESLMRALELVLRTQCDCRGQWGRAVLPKHLDQVTESSSRVIGETPKGA